MPLPGTRPTATATLNRLSVRESKTHAAGEDPDLVAEHTVFIELWDYDCREDRGAYG